ncbi:MAG UNVERIFIED_CONTAM: conjugal transfer protein TraD [Rickettsiaceae bacterium]|jgi:hypothetical protein
MSVYKKVNEQKAKLEAKKNRLILEENKIKEKERKMRTRHLIEVGGLVVKVGLDHLPTNTLYGALLTLSEKLNQNSSIQDTWTNLGAAAFKSEQKTTTPIILKLKSTPEKNIRDLIRNHNLSWNRLRKEWYGNVHNLDELKKSLENTEYEIEVIPD